MTEFIYHGRDGCPLYATIISPEEQPAAADEHPVLVLLHGGGPDHHSLMPLARLLADHNTVALPDIRGYGRSVCTDPARHTWAQYADDVIALLDHLGERRAVVGGAGLGGSITLRAALARPDRVRAAIVIGVEDIEDDEKKEAEIVFLDAFAERVRSHGIEAAWEPILNDLAPVIGSMVRDAIPRSDPASIAAAAAIGRDRSFHTVDELQAVAAPTLIIPGDGRAPPRGDSRRINPGAPAGAPRARDHLRRPAHGNEDFAWAFAPAIRDFLISTVSRT